MDRKNVNVEFGNTARDCLLNAKIGDEQARAEAVETTLYNNTGTTVGAVPNDVEVTGTAEPNHELAIVLRNTSGQAISTATVNFSVIASGSDLFMRCAGSETWFDMPLAPVLAVCDSKVAAEKAARKLVDGQLSDRIKALEKAIFNK